MSEERTIRKTFSRIGFALCVLMILREGAGILISLLHSCLLKAPQGSVAAAIRSWMESSWFQLVGRSLISYAIVIPVFLWILSSLPGGIPGDIRIKKKLRVKKILSLFVIAMGLGYVFNLVGVIINLMIAFVKRGDFAALNPVTDIMQQISPLNAIYVGLIAPMIEEFLFRGIILGKTKKYGESTAIVFSAVLFGLLHGNIAQTMYATFIGLILGYTAVKTGGIVYSCIIHMMINSYSTLLAFGVKHIGGYYFAAFFSFSVTAMAFIFLVLAIVLLCLNWRRTSYEKGEILEAAGTGRMMGMAFLNPGVLLFTVFCVGMMAYYVVIS